MSVLIKGIEMPNNCSECNFEYDQMRCQVTGYNWYDQEYLDIGFDPNIERLPECPLAELPEHHRRLIDADATCADLDTVNPKYQYWINWAKRTISDQPIIIEAE